MGFFKDTPRETSKKISKGEQAPRNLDKNNPVIKKAEEYAASIQKVTPGWEKYMPAIEKYAKEICAKSKYDFDSKVYFVTKKIRKYNGDGRVATSIVSRLSK